MKLNLQLPAEELRHGLLNEAVVDGLLRLVRIRGLRRKRRGNQNKAVLNIGEDRLALAFLNICCSAFKYWSICETMACLTARSGAPPCSSQLEL